MTPWWRGTEEAAIDFNHYFALLNSINVDGKEVTNMANLRKGGDGRDWMRVTRWQGPPCGIHLPMQRCANTATADAANLERARAFGFLSQPGKHTLAQAAYRFILTHPGVTTVLSGFSEMTQLEELVPAGCGVLEDEEMKAVEHVWKTL